MTTATTETKLLCPECRHENEAERIYCHDCGTRLDRSAVRLKKEPIQDTHKRVKRMFDPHRAKMRALFFAVSKMILGAGVLALVINMFLAPDVPPPTKNPLLLSSLRFDLESMAAKRQPPQKQVTEAEANALLASALKSKQTSLDKPLLPFKRALVAFHQNGVVLTTERSLSGYWPVYASCTVVPELKAGRLLGKITGGRIGRLPIHPKLAQHMGPLFGDVVAALDRDLKLVSKVGAIELHDKNAILSAPAP